MLIREAADPALTARQRGKLVRAIAAREHADPSGRPVRLTRWTLDRWIRMWQQGGFDALVPAPRQCQPRTPPEVMELAAALKKENPARTAAQVQRILRAQAGWAPDETTIQRMFRRTGLTALTPAADAPASGRFEASRPDEIWTGDAMHAIRLAGRKTYLFAFIDDHSRAVMAARFGFAEDTIRLAAALRPALASRGIPAHAYVDNGSAFVDAWLLRACAKLGIKLVHSQPRRPEGKGKIERFFRTVRDGFLVELTGERAARIPDLSELNKLFTAWTEALSTTSGSIRRPGSRRWPGGKPAARSRSRPRRTWLRRSAGPDGEPCPRRPWSPCTATSTRPTRRWPAAAWSWSSTRYDELRIAGLMVGRALCGGQRRGPHSSSSDGVGDDELDIIPGPDGGFLDRDGPGEEVNHDGRPEPRADPRPAERACGGLRRRTTAEGLPA
jgi:transposase InsO family protein